MNIKKMTIPVVALSAMFFAVGCNSTNQDTIQKRNEEDIEVVDEKNIDKYEASFEEKFWESTLVTYFFYYSPHANNETPTDLANDFSEDNDFEVEYLDDSIIITDSIYNISVIIPTTSSDESALIEEPIKLRFNDEQINMEYLFSNSTDPNIFYSNCTVAVPSGETSEGNDKLEAFEFARKYLRSNGNETYNIDTSRSIAKKYWNSNIVKCFFEIKLSDGEETMTTLTEKIKSFDSKGTFEVEIRDVDGYNRTIITETDTNIELSILNEENLRYDDLYITFKNENVYIEHGGEYPDKGGAYFVYKVDVGGSETLEGYDKVTLYERVRDLYNK